MTGKATRGALAAAVAASAALAVVAVPEGGSLRPLLPLPAAEAPDWGAGWSSRVIPVGSLAADALGERVLLVAVALAGLALLGLLTALLGLLGRREAVRPELAVRWVVGRAPRQLARLLLERAGRGVAGASLLGLALGAGLGAALRVTWPVSGTGTAPAWEFLAAGVVVCLALTLLAVASPAAGIDHRGLVLLRVGSGGTDDPRAGTVRRAAATLQLAVAFALVSAGATLGGTVPDPSGGSRTAGDTALIPLRATAAGVDWGAVELLLSRTGGGAAAESLSTPGAWTGLGVRDLVTVQCGNCSRGGLPLPIYGVSVTEHAVSARFFEQAGLEVLEGRGFLASDTAGAELVGVVNLPLGRTHFEGGRPLGRKIRLGGPGERWVTVVGVVEAMEDGVPGGATALDPVLYLPLAQHPARRVEWAVPGLTEVTPALPEGAPVTAVGEPRTVAAQRDRARSPVRWAGRVLLGVGLVGLVLALGAAAEASAAEVRGRWREAAIRASVGARPAILAGTFLRRAAMTAVVGAAVGQAVAWAVVETLGSGVGVSLRLAAALGGLLVGACLGGALGPARTAARSDPAGLLREG